jgi:hypothetical protein
MRLVKWNTTLGLRALAPKRIALVAALLCVSGVQAGNLEASAPATPVQVLQQAVRSETESLKRAAEALARATTASEQKLIGEELRTVVERRERDMLVLIQASPEAALQEALPSADRNQLPEEVRAHVEQPATRSGTLEVLGVLADDGRPGIELHLITGGQNLRLAVALSDEFVSGTQLTVRGLLLGDWLVGAKDDLILDKAVTAPLINGTLQTRFALVINVNFSDETTEPWTIDLATQRFAEITDWYLETSYEQMTIVSDVIGWFTIDASSTSCATTTFRAQAEAAARAVGYEPNDYNHVVVVFPRVASCGFAGLAQVPGRYVWLNNTISRSAATHELGHNLGLLHSHSQRCSVDPLRGTCSGMEYGDIFDAMGSGAAEYHASFRTYLGWIPSSDVLSVSVDDGDVLAVLRSPETPYGTRLLQVLRATGDYLFVEAREAIGFDSVLTQYPAVLNGVTVYLGPSFRSQSLVDIGFTTVTRTDAPLEFGDTLYDVDGDLSIAPLYNLDGDVYVQVHFGLSPP